jgi:acetyltransferase
VELTGPDGPLPGKDGNGVTNRSLPDAFFKPGTVAVVGASKKAMFSSGIPDSLVKYGYRDRVYLVNPRETEINGMPVYARLADIPAPVDLAIVVVPATQAPIVVRECVKLGIPAVVLESTGFGETGPEGARLEDELRRLPRGARTRVIGPNCLGVINPHESFATTPVDLKALRPGNIGVIAQSGTFGNILADWAPTQDLYFSKLVTIGNRLDVDETDCLLYFAEDAQTDVIVLYLEGVKDGRRFYEATREVSRRKPVLVYKGGRSPAGL